MTTKAEQLASAGSILTTDINGNVVGILSSAASSSYTATAGQTVFVLTAGAYTPGSGSLAVYMNGLKLRPGIDYLETSITSFTLTSGATVGDEVDCIVGNLVNTTAGATAGTGSGLAPIMETYTATASQTVFNTVTTYIPGANTIDVYVNGIHYNLTADYTETSGNSITFNSGLTVGDEVNLKIWRSGIVSASDASLVAYTPLSGGSTTVQAKLRGLDSSVALTKYVPLTNDYAGILAAFNLAVAGGGGEVSLNAVTYNIGNNTLPRASGVSYVGVTPGIISYLGTGITAAPDIGNITFVNGTVINGGGSNIAFASQTMGSTSFTGSISGTTLTVTAVTSGVIGSGVYLIGSGVSVNTTVVSQLTGSTGGVGTYSVSTSGTTTSTAIKGFNCNVVTNSNLKGMGFTNVAQAFVSGSQDCLGDAWSSIENLYIYGATGNPIEMFNFEHINVKNIRNFVCNGSPQFAMYSSTSNWGGYGNSVIKSVYDYKNNISNAPPMRFGSSGLELNTLTLCNTMTYEDIQANHYNRSTITQVATCNSTTSITVTDGSKFPVGMPVWLSATSGQLLGGANSNSEGPPAYFVVSSVGNVIQLAYSPMGAALTAGTGTPNISQCGMPLVQFSGNFSLTQLDVEGSSGAPVLFNGASGIFNKAATSLNTVNSPAIVGGPPQYVCRTSSYLTLNLGGTLSLDTVSGTNNVIQLYGAVLTRAQTSIVTGEFGTNKNSNIGLNLAKTVPSSGAITFMNKQPGNGDFTVPGLPFGVCQGYNSSTNVSFSNTGSSTAGFGTYTGAGIGIWNFSTGLGTSTQGLKQQFKNNGTGALTVVLGSSDGTFDGISPISLGSLSVGAGTNPIVTTSATGGLTLGGVIQASAIGTTNLTLATNYYITAIVSNTSFTLSATPQGGAISPTVTAGSATLTTTGKSVVLAAPITGSASALSSPGGTITIVQSQIGASSYQWSIESMNNAVLL